MKKIIILFFILNLFLTSCWGDGESETTLFRTYVSLEVANEFTEKIRSAQLKVGEGNQVKSIAVGGGIVFYEKSGNINSVKIDSSGNFILRYYDEAFDTQILIRSISEKETGRADKKIEYIGLSKNEDIEDILESHIRRINNLLN